MDIKTLEAFLALADHLNFTKSAERLYISQPAFSRQITRLEDEFGCELFLRNRRRVELTEYGRAFQEHAQTMYAEYEKWMVHLQHMKSQKTGHLGVGFLQDLPHDFFPRAVRAFEAANGNVEVSFHDRTVDGILDGLLKGEIDVGFSLAQETGGCEGVCTLKVASMPLCAALPEGHPLAGEETVRLEALRDEPFVMISPDGYAPGSRHIGLLCRMAGFEPRAVALTQFVPSLLMLVKCGVGVTILAQTAENIAPPGVKLVPLHRDIARIDLLLLWREASGNPAVQAFVDSTQSLLEQDAEAN